MPANRENSGLFQKGQSGNPNGRPKIPVEVREAIRAACPQAVEYLIELMSNPEEKTAYRLDAAKTLLDRGYGKPVQMQDVQLDMSGAVSLDAQIRAILIERDKNRFYADDVLVKSENVDDNTDNADNASSPDNARAE